MKLIIFSILAGVLTLSQPATIRADQASHRKAAETLLSSIDMSAIMEQSVDQMLQAQIKSSPALAVYEPELKSFLKKYMSWAALKDDMVKLYVDAFTETELNELTKFYQTPLGKKTMKTLPGLMASGAEIGQRQVQAHLPELEATIKAKETDPKSKETEPKPKAP